MSRGGAQASKAYDDVKPVAVLVPRPSASPCAFPKTDCTIIGPAVTNCRLTRSTATTTTTVVGARWYDTTPHPARHCARACVSKDVTNDCARIPPTRAATTLHEHRCYRRYCDYGYDRHITTVVVLHTTVDILVDCTRSLFDRVIVRAR